MLLETLESAVESRALTIRLASPRGFCAGVERAIRTVEEALALFGRPVYVRHEIVHNIFVIRRLEAMGAIFVDEIADVEAGRPVIVSAHGAPQRAFDEARSRGLAAIDATCPLVLKVHQEIRRHVARGRHVLLIGHAGHPEVIGSMGQAPQGAVTLIESLADADRVAPSTDRLAYATQTTLSVDDAAEIIATLQQRFPTIEGPRKADICYATQNRQEAVKLVAPGADLALIVGSAQSSNSKRLVETARAAGARAALLVEDPAAFDLALVEDAQIIGVSAGASTPEFLVEDLLTRLARKRAIVIETIEAQKEDISFKLPALLAG